MNPIYSEVPRFVALTPPKRLEPLRLDDIESELLLPHPPGTGVIDGTNDTWGGMYFHTKQNRWIRAWIDQNEKADINTLVEVSPGEVAEAFGKYYNRQRRQGWPIEIALNLFPHALRELLAGKPLFAELYSALTNSTPANADAPVLPRPNWNSNARPRLLTYGDAVCREYRRPAPNQFKVLDALHSKNWEEWAQVSLRAEQLSQTVRDMNEELVRNCPIRFKSNDKNAGWGTI